ncbi:sugar ABC transporter ATP-binding protein [Saccharopolyspora hattusasensis]|uniref:sugar ABC transporter ATP-binding protein n=1 Tax=Saccharopolyspora hattusasensis TaxID=1128679 RepID=UPI003D956C61
MEHIGKRFEGVVALDDVDFTVGRGEVHALVGENGAGKSTLMKVLAGAHQADDGRIVIDSHQVQAPTPARMLELGVTVIYQELTLAPHLSVAENIFLNRLPKGRWGHVDWSALRRRSAELLERLGIALDVDARVGTLSIAQQQMVEIARALSRDARLIVLDEPSAVLGDTEIATLFEIIRGLQERGIAFIYISHRLKEIFEIADRITVLRDGRSVATRRPDQLTADDLVGLMVGRQLDEIYPPRDRVSGEPALAVEHLSQGNRLNDISFTAYAGEILGIAGLAGAGRTELLRALLGADPHDGGRILLHGKPARFRSPREAIAAGVGLLPEDRKDQALFLNQTIRFNIGVGALSAGSGGPVLRTRSERAAVTDLARRLDVRAPHLEMRIRNLSGGNQQKCVLGRWLAADCRLLLVDEPTRGVDVGAKQEIYRLLHELAHTGVTIVMVSSELPEILGLSDRILVMRDGTIAAELAAATATEELIMRHATDHGSATARV